MGTKKPPGFFYWTSENTTTPDWKCNLYCDVNPSPTLAPTLSLPLLLPLTANTHILHVTDVDPNRSRKTKV